MAEEAGEKSQEATPHRRQKAREEGHVAQSQDLSSAVMLMTGLGGLLYIGADLLQTGAKLIARFLGENVWLEADRGQILVESREAFLAGLGAVLPLGALLVMIGIGTTLVQVGFVWTPERIMPDLSRLSPLQGFSRLFSMPNFVRLAFGMFKLVVVAGVACACLRGQFGRIAAMSGMDTAQVGLFLCELVIWTGLKVGFALLVLALLDFGFQKWKFEKDLRMTSQEMREEMKDLQGNPQVIARRRQVQRQLVLNRLKDSVPKADVVVTNPTELAIAIQYKPDEMLAPIVVAKGAGVMAQRIRKLALEHNIPILEKKPLAQKLFKLVDVNHPIPNDLYAAVAEVLAYVYQLKGKKLPKPPNAA